MRVLVTGGCGFIGRNLIAALARDADRTVTVLDDESAGTRAALDDFDGRTVRGSVTDPASLRDALRDVDEVVHLAASTSVVASVAHPERSLETNVVGTVRLLEHCRRAGVRRVLFASTAGAMAGDSGEAVGESAPAAPASPYGASKLAGEAYCGAYAASYGLETVALRFSNVYGPGSDHKTSAVAAFCGQILRGLPLIVHGNGLQFRDFIHVGDLCEGILLALRSKQTGVFNLASGESSTIGRLIEIIARVATPTHRVSIRFEAARPGEIFGSQVDIAKARNLLGFDPATPLDVGIRQTWDWFLRQHENGERHQPPAALAASH